MKKVLFCVCAIAAFSALCCAPICDGNGISAETGSEIVSSYLFDAFSAASSVTDERAYFSGFSGEEARYAVDGFCDITADGSPVFGREREISHKGTRGESADGRDEGKRGLTHVSSFSTTFDRSVYARSYNIALACSNFCYYRVGAGERLSFNTVVGKRTAERGYKEAKVIENGVYVPGIGGGVCQVSTTLYNAWITAGLKVEYVRAHSLPSSYCAMSRDATVSDWIDLVLFNDSGSDVVVNATVTGNKVTFDVYGMPSPYSYRYETRVLEKIAPPDPVIEYVSYIEGDLERKEISPAKNGWVSELVRHTYIDDEEIGRDVVRRDVYNGVAARIQVKENID